MNNNKNTLTDRRAERHNETDERIFYIRGDIRVR